MEDNNEEVTLDGLLGSLGAEPKEDSDMAGDNNPVEKETDSTDQGTNDTPEDAGPKDTSDQGEPDESKSGESKEAPVDVRSSQAFAQMRIENKKYQKMIDGLAKVLGMEDTSDPDKVNEAIQNKIIESQAKQQNTDPKILARLMELEEKDQIATQEQIRQQAFLGFQKVKENFDLSNKDLEKFASDLQEAGMNPFGQKLDLVREYKIMHLDRLVADAESKGAQKEMERSAKASQQGTTPAKQRGQKQGDAGDKKITSVRDLEKWMATESK